MKKKGEFNFLLVRAFLPSSIANKKNKKALIERLKAKRASQKINFEEKFISD